MNNQFSQVQDQWEQQLRCSYACLQKEMKKSEPKRLCHILANLTADEVVRTEGPDAYRTDSAPRPYSELIRMRCVNYPLGAERQRFLRSFAGERLMKAFAEAKKEISDLFFTRRSNGSFCYTQLRVRLFADERSKSVMAEMTETEADNEKITEILMENRPMRPFTSVSYLSGDNYRVLMEPASSQDRTNVFPAPGCGNYLDYMKNRIRPHLCGTPEQQERMMHALLPETIEKELSCRSVYAVNAAFEVLGEIYYKRFDFYPASGGAKFYVMLGSDRTEIKKLQQLKTVD